MPEICRGIQSEEKSEDEMEVISLQNVVIIRRAPPDSQYVLNQKSKRTFSKQEKRLEKLQKMEKRKLLSFSADSEVIAFRLEALTLSIKKVANNVFSVITRRLNEYLSNREDLSGFAVKSAVGRVSQTPNGL